MTIVEKKPVPIYEITCYECKSKIRYKAAEVYCSHINCPVCGVSNWASVICPVTYEEGENLSPVGSEVET